MFEANSEWSEILHGIKEIKTIRRTWGKDFTERPVAIYLETANVPSVMTGEGEAVSRVQYTVHLFTDTYKEGRAIVDKINSEAQDRLWTRMMYNHFPEDNEHFVLMFQTEVDLDTNEKFVSMY